MANFGTLEKRALAEYTAEQPAVSDEVLRYRMAAARVSPPNRLAIQAVQGIARQAGLTAQPGFREYRLQNQAHVREFRDAVAEVTLTRYDRTMAEFPRRAREVGIVAYLQEAEDFHCEASGSNTTPLGVPQRIARVPAILHWRAMMGGRTTFPY
jgi:hypothetical protein